MLRGASNDSEVSTRNFSAHATSRRQKTTLTPTTITIISAMAKRIAGISFCRSQRPAQSANARQGPRLAADNGDCSESAKKNQPPPTLIMPFHTRPIMQ
jgi:hypothetical protein